MRWVMQLTAAWLMSSCFLDWSREEGGQAGGNGTGSGSSATTTAGNGGASVTSSTATGGDGPVPAPNCGADLYCDDTEVCLYEKEGPRCDAWRCADSRGGCEACPYDGSACSQGDWLCCLGTPVLSYACGVACP